MPKGPKGQHPSNSIFDTMLIAPKRKKLNANQRRNLKAASLQLFAKQYARKAQHGCEPNDRQYDRDIELQAKRMKPEELDCLLNQDADD